MTGFFQQAPPLNSLQKRFIESIVHKHNVVGSFPLAYPTASLYAFAAFMSNTGLAVAVCPDRLAVSRLGRYFGNLGYGFPDLAVLDGTQMPHEERETYEAINRNKVRLLLTTPTQFNTLNFLNMMVHSKVSFVLVEQAQMLLPDFPGNYRYKKLIEALSRLQQQPPLVLLAQPLSPERQAQLKSAVHIQEADAFGESPLWEKARLSVVRLITEQQKIRFLRQQVQLLPSEPQEPVVIVVGDNRNAQYVFKLLENMRYGDIRMVLPGMTVEERKPVEEWFAAAESPVLICTEYEAPLFRTMGRSSKIIYWQPPASVDAVLGHVYTANSENDPVSVAYLLHTREDYTLFVNRYKKQSETEPDAQFRQFALKRYRQWVLSQSCRRQTMAAYYAGRVLADVLPCGACDRCAQKTKNPLQRLMEHLLY